MSSRPELVAEMLEFSSAPQLDPRYNISPTQPVPAAIQPADSSGRVLTMLRWGLIPSWADDPAIGNRMINARAETVAEKPAFRHALRRRRCLIIADGFYEWQKVDGGKQPHHIRRRDAGPFALAGLWERWVGEDESTIDSCTILTTTPNDTVRPIHNRMPVILGSSDYDLWLDPEVTSPERLVPLLTPCSSDELIAVPVSTAVNNPRNESPDCVKPLV